MTSGGQYGIVLPVSNPSAPLVLQYRRATLGGEIKSLLFSGLVSITAFDWSMRVLMTSIASFTVSEAEMNTKASGPRRENGRTEPLEIRDKNKVHRCRSQSGP